MMLEVLELEFGHGWRTEFCAMVVSIERLNERNSDLVAHHISIA